MTRTRLAVTALLLALGALHAHAADIAAPGSDWNRYVQQFLHDYFVANPSFAVGQGRHEFDGQLPDWSAAGLKAEQERLLAARARLASFADRALQPSERFERDYLLARVDGDLFWLRDAEAPFTNPAYYTGTLDPTVYLTRPYAAPDVRMKAFIAYAKALPKAAAQIRANLRLPMPKTYVQLGINSFGGYPDFFRKDVPAIFAEVKDPALQAELSTAIDVGASAMQGLADWLKTEQAHATDQFALGPKKFAAMLKATERVETPIAKLLAIGKADLKRNQKALKLACGRYAPGKSISACIEKMAADKPEGGPVPTARAQLADLKAFVQQHDLVSIPGPEEALVAEAPPYQRWNFAYIDIAGPYEVNMPSVYNIAPPDPSWSQADQLAYIPGKADLLFTSAHEVWPGHFLQFLHANRAPSEIGRVFVGYAFAEGWAHYTEEMMLEAGLGEGAPEYQIGQLSNALLRNVRFICAIGLHTQGLSVQQCETLFRKEAWQDPGNSRQQAARGTYDPAYLNYTLGKLMILKLRADWTATRGGKASWKAFHDQFLAYGGPPIPLVRKAMLGPSAGPLF